MKMFAQALTNLEIQMNAVERLKEYSKLPEEPPASIPETKPSDNWPDKGRVEFKDYSFRYREGLPLVINKVSYFFRLFQFRLHNNVLFVSQINMKISAGQKIGIVGRTGSGKSTYRLAFPFSSDFILIEIAMVRLVSALYMLAPPAEGTIFIDGVDVSKLGVEDLRMKLAIIPQVPPSSLSLSLSSSFALYCSLFIFLFFFLQHVSYTIDAHRIYFYHR